MNGQQIIFKKERLSLSPLFLSSLRMQSFQVLHPLRPSS